MFLNQDKLNYTYLGFLCLLCFLLKLDFLFLYFFIWWATVWSHKENNVELCEDSYELVEEGAIVFDDNEVENPELEEQETEFEYLCNGCNFFFYTYGGNKCLDEADNFYNQYKIFNIKNFINVYKTLENIEKFNKNSYFLEDFKLKYSNKRFINNLKDMKNVDNLDLNLWSNQKKWDIYTEKIQNLREKKFLRDQNKINTYNLNKFNKNNVKKNT